MRLNKRSIISKVTGIYEEGSLREGNIYISSLTIFLRHVQQYSTCSYSYLWYQ